ncbi:MAG: DUF4136 domain-containing protein [Bacteroidales bacterium]|nr:DUF4136 domain-containing protein [Bacteroidales bacterium]MBR5532200.1 DUF4136 domain-containing protein [Bacteroidales bacterium]
MKRLTTLLMIVVLLSTIVSCQKDPDFDELSTEFVTYTDYDKSVDFSKYSTFYISDTIKVLSGKVENWYDENAQSIISTFASNMKDRGYVQLAKAERESADLGIQLSYIENTYYFTDYYSPYYWYDWWWGSYYWWDWGPIYPYPSYAVTYRYDVGSLLGEIISIDKTTEKLQQIWSMCVGGTMSGSTRTDVNKAKRGVNQAFNQSEYIRK